MEYTRLGSTGFHVSQLGLGAGGSSQLGVDSGNAERVLETALDCGVRLIDTAEAYGTEEVIGSVLRDRSADDVVLSTKFSVYDDGQLRRSDEIAESVHGSIDRLGVDTLDVYHLHGVRPEDYEYAAETLRPRLRELQEQGLIRAVGITESVSADPNHELLAQAVSDGAWDVLMVGFNLLNHTAKSRVLEPARAQGIGTIGMVPVRRAIADEAYLKDTIEELIERGEIDPTTVDLADPLGFLTGDGRVRDRFDAAYRFAAHEPTVDCVLTGTSRPSHLRANVTSVERGPLPDDLIAEIETRFGKVTSLIGD